MPVRTGVVLLVVVLASAACATGQSSGADGRERVGGRSKGCAVPDREYARLRGGGTFPTGGSTRAFNLRLPEDRGGPAPLVVNLHGALGNKDQQDRSSQLPELAVRRGMAVLSPNAGQGTIWDLRVDGRDAGALLAQIDDVEAKVCIDTNRVYLVGFSMGGMISQVLACSNADRFAAIGDVAGLIDVETCSRERPVPLIAFEGTSDDVVRFDGSFADNVALFLPSKARTSRIDVARRWAEKNGCQSEPSEKSVAANVRRLEYPCPAGAEVQLYV
ncbi:MAG: hypothetical protein HYX32_14090 [Actinobacteria bacterium]|nr:hypothetical protein [Actinomycetota bacterium]